MGLHSWRGASQQEHTFATYPIILPCDVASVARFYIGVPIVYAFVADKPGMPALQGFSPLYFGQTDDGYKRLYLEHHGATAAALDVDCVELHILRADMAEGKRAQIVADLLAANPASLNTPVFNNPAFSAQFRAA